MFDILLENDFFFKALILAYFLLLLMFLYFLVRSLKKFLDILFEKALKILSYKVKEQISEEFAEVFDAKLNKNDNEIEIDDAEFEKSKKAYHNGDYAETLDIVTKLSKKGHLKGKTGLAYLYHTGKGIDQDHKKAMELSYEAAKLGHPTAQNNLGASYYEGTGIAQNYMLAYAWFSLAKAQGNGKAERNLDKVTEKMTLETVAQAQEKALELEAGIKANIKAKKAKNP